MLEFKEPCVDDSVWAQPLISAAGCMENDAAFANIFLLRHKYGTEICRYGDFLLRRYSHGNRTDCYGFPVGNGDLRAAVDFLVSLAHDEAKPLKLTLLTEQMKHFLEENYPAAFSFSEQENYSEYLYLRQNLAELKGKKYHGKRNHIAQFIREYPDFSAEPVCGNNSADAYSVAEKWYEQHEDKSDSVTEELSAIREALENFDALSLYGMIIYANGMPAAMTIASRISDGNYDTHYEKALREFPHVYPVVTSRFAASLSDARYINREEDLGFAGLKQAKFSFNPDIILNKYSAVMI